MAMNIKYDSINKDIQHVYHYIFKNTYFQEIDHAPEEFCNQYFSIQDKCLVVSYSSFDKYYQLSLKQLKKSQAIQQKLMLSDILLSMNGQNDYAWNTKKLFLNQKDQNDKFYLNLQYELRFNGAVCLKCKKSSTYYQYRLRLIDRNLSQIIQTYNYSIEDIISSLQKLHQSQNNLIHRVLQRFFRNYFCWMYRIKLIKLIKAKLQQKQLHQIVQSFLIKQIEFIQKFIQKYCNDYSAYSYLISLLIKCEKFDSFNKIKQQQIKWIQQMKEYCQVVYQNKKDYQHLLMLQKIIKKQSKSTQLIS